ncbi:hypothetical protein TSUD_40090 [Trifolium subterraneum]|uniref:Uncharacterized protein n=1 Tax=Trifolium subterraneum TaxID=3900 RepID=A0A2Z6MJH9_TRISU|nr:hypothetical protein TSUD_40090 [Trifolium subterraneum]
MPAPSQPELYNVRLWSAAATDLFQLIGVQAYRPSLAGMDFSSNSFLAIGYEYSGIIRGTLQCFIASAPQIELKGFQILLGVICLQIAGTFVLKI